MLTQTKARSGALQGGRVVFLPLSSIRPNPAQPRTIFDAQGLQELAASIRQYGVLQPLTVRKKAGFFELVAGERRLRAAGLAGLRLEDETSQLRAIRLITEHDWTVARTERYVDEQLSAAKGKARLSRFVLRDMRLFLNGINHQLDLIRAAGLNPQTEQEETERELVLTIRIPKSVSGR